MRGGGGASGVAAGVRSLKTGGEGLRGACRDMLHGHSDIRVISLSKS